MTDSIAAHDDPLVGVQHSLNRAQTHQQQLQHNPIQLTIHDQYQSPPHLLSSSRTIVVNAQQLQAPPEQPMNNNHGSQNIEDFVPLTEQEDMKKSKKAAKVVKQESGILRRFYKKKDSMTSNDGNQDANQQQQSLRDIHVDPTFLPEQPPDNLHFISNSITTTKYTIWSFLPKAIIVQFMRMSNVYFLATAILCTIPGLTPVTPASVFLPLCFVIFMSIMREAYEDYKRRTNDRVTNNQKCRIYRDRNQFEHNKEQTEVTPMRNNLKWIPTKCMTKEETDYLRTSFKECLWKDVRCGDIIFIEEGEHLPGDIVFLMSSAENGECFVQTATLDGERALKHKQCLVPIKTAIEQRGLNNFMCNVHCEPPTKNLYEFSGFIESDQFPEKGTVQIRQDSKKRTISLDNKQLGLRGSNLANTNWAIGVVAYTGKDTKLMLNQGLSRFKQSRIEKVVNKICIYLIIAQAIFCIIMSVYSSFYVSNYAELTSDGLRRKAEYIFYTQIGTSVRSVNGTATDSNSIGYSSTKEAFMTYGVYFILLNTLIPISLVVSIEFIKLVQAPFMAYDLSMYDEASMKQAQPMSMTLHEEMAQIKYIFADKTGTLTANIMQFKACTIGSVCYDEEYRDEDYEYENGEGMQEGVTPGGDAPPQIIPAGDTTGLIQEEFRIPVNGEDIREQMNIEEFEKYKSKNRETFNKPGEESKILRRGDSITKIVWNYKEAAPILRNLLEKDRYFLNEETNLGQSRLNGPFLILKKQNDYLHQFWMNVVLCHDVITTLNQNSNQLVYQGTSPDEITLLDAAKEVGYAFMDRNSESMEAEIFGKKKSFRLLQKFEFTSDRKKMTVVVQDETTGLVILYSKGADLAIFDRLSVQLEQHFLEATKEDLIKFSTKGYRTLCFAIRVLDEAYFKDWQIRYETAKLEAIRLGAQMAGKPSGFDPNVNLNALINEIESNMFLLGATALEDKLQDGVPEAIEDFRNAGMKVWMLTGDKLETAENIGFSSKMFNEKMFIFKLQTTDKQTTRTRMQQIESKMAEIEKQHATPVIGTQFILNPNAAMDYEAKNIIRALEEFKHESRASEYTMNESWARKPVLRRKIRKRLEEIVPDKNAIAERLIKENQIFFQSQKDIRQYIPQSFDMKSNQYIVRPTNVFRSKQSQDIIDASKSLNLGGINLNLPNSNSNNNIIDNEDKFGIIIEGHTLAFIQDSKSMKEKFLKILAKCEAVVVCRASPSQKGQVVQMIKTSEPDAVTLAIGDGANDVNMIQRAHVGIGIFGKEGYQAASNSDYAIGQFRFLRRLLFVHGRWSGLRITLFMLLFFNKNIAYTLPQFWFGWNNGFSGSAYYDDIYMSCFNLFATNLAVCCIAVWDIDIVASNDKLQGVIELFLPQIYKFTKENELFTTKKFLGWSALSILQSLFIYGIPILTFDNYVFSDGKEQDFWAQGVCSYFSVVLLHYATVAFFTRNWQWWITLWFFVSMGLFAPFQIVTYDNFPGTFLTNRLKEIVFSNWQFWVTLVLTITVCFVPMAFYFCANSLLFPSLKDLIQQHAFDQKEVLDEADPNKEKQATELFKQKQLQAQAKWDAEYNNFNLPERGQGSSQINRSSHQFTPKKKSHSSPVRTAAAHLGSRLDVVMEKVGIEDSKMRHHIHDDESQPFEIASEILKLQKEDHHLAAVKNSQQHHVEASPMRVSNARKGLSLMKHQNSGTIHEPHNNNKHQRTGGMAHAKHLFVDKSHPLNIIDDDEEQPLRLSRGNCVGPKGKLAQPTPDTVISASPEQIDIQMDEEYKLQDRMQRSHISEEGGSEDLSSEADIDAKNLTDNLVQKMQILKKHVIDQNHKESLPLEDQVDSPRSFAQKLPSNEKSASKNQ